MDFLAKETKTTISGVLVSSKFRMTMKKLDKDFQEQVGYSIPYKKLGYGSLETYLRSLHDTVQVQGEGDYAEVIGVSKMSSHVLELVARQKCPKAKNRFVKPNYRTSSSYQYHPQYNNVRYFHNSYSYVNPAARPKQYNNYERQNFNRPSEGYSRPESRETCVTPAYKTRTYENSKNIETANNSNSDASFHTTYSDLSNKDEVDNSPTGYHATGQNATTYFNIQKSSSRKSSRNESNQGLNETVETCPTLDTISAKQGSVVKSSLNFETSSRISSSRHSLSALSDDEVFYSDEEELNTRVPQIVQDNLRTLVKKYPDGIWCAKVPDLYKKEFGRNLEYTEYGYVSLAQMCLDLGNTFHCVQPDQSDYKLFDKSLHITNDNLMGIKISEYLKIRASVQESTKPALPAGVEELLLHIHQDNIPEGVVKLGTYIERQWIEPTENVESFIDVNVAEVYDPSKFWFNLKRLAPQLNKLMDNMQIFYEANAQTYAVPKLGLKVGLYISVIFLKEYHRAVIVDTEILYSKNLLRAFFIDYGSVSLVSADGVCYLHEQFVTLPAQAIRSRLTGIYPPQRHQQWSRSISSLFLLLVKNKDLVAQIIRIHKEKELLEILLADTSDEEDFFINDALAFERDHARFMSEEQLPPIKSKYVPIVPYIHLFPTFDELETGKVPNATEMIYFENAGIGIERIYPHYFKNTEESAKPEEGAVGSWKFDYDLAEKNYNQSYEPDKDDGFWLKPNRGGTEKIEALIKPVASDKKHDWIELLSEEDIPVTPKKTPSNAKVEAQTKSKAIKQSIPKQRNQSKNNLILHAEMHKLTSKKSPVVLNDQVVVHDAMSSVPKIKETETFKAAINSPVSDHHATVVHDEISSYPKIKEIETVEETMMPHEINKLPKTNSLNPEKPPFVPLLQTNVTYSNPNVTGIKRSIPPPPGFNNVQPVPLQHNQSMNYENAPQSNYVQQVLNVNQIHQLQFSLQNVQPEISPRDLSLIYRYYPNVSPQVALFLLQTSYQMQNHQPNPGFPPNPPPSYYPPYYPGYHHPQSSYYPHHQPQTWPPRNDVPPHNGVPPRNDLHPRNDLPPHNDVPRRNDVLGPPLYANSPPQFRQEHGNNVNANSLPQFRQESYPPRQETNVKINNVHSAAETQLKSENAPRSATRNDDCGDPNCEDISQILKNIDLESVISETINKRTQAQEKEFNRSEEPKVKSQWKDDEVLTERSEAETCSINKDYLKKEIILQILEAIKSKNLQIQEPTTEDKYITRQNTTEKYEKDIIKQGVEEAQIKLDGGRTNLEYSERNCLHEDHDRPQDASFTMEKTAEGGQDNIKCVARHVLGNLTVHVITHNNNIFFSLEEMTCIFLGKPISAVQIRKMFIGKEHSVSFFDISLKKYPQLGQELLEFGLIKKTALTMNIIAVSDVAQFLKILTKECVQLSDSEMFLSDVKKLIPAVTSEY